MNEAYEGFTDLLLGVILLAVVLGIRRMIKGFKSAKVDQVKETERVTYDTLKKPEYYPMVRSFLLKHRTKLVTINCEPRAVYDEHSLSLLSNWLRTHGFEPPSDEILTSALFSIKSDVNEETEREHFLRRMKSHTLESLDDYLEACVEEFGSESPDKAKFLLELLGSRSIDYDEVKLRYMVEERLRTRETRGFEREMLGDHADRRFGASVDEMTGEEFELFLAGLFKRMGYKTDRTTLSHDQGADLIVSKGGVKIVVQAKRSSGSIGNKAVQEVVAAVKHYEADRGMVVTNAFFTSAAAALASSNGVELVNGNRLESWISEYM